MKKLIHYLKAKYLDFLSDLKYDRELRKVYRRANARIKEAQQRCRIEGRQFYVLPDPNKKGDFFCISPKERQFMVAKKILSDKFDGLFCIKNAIFIANPNGKHEKRHIKVKKEWLIGK